MQNRLWLLPNFNKKFDFLLPSAINLFFVCHLHTNFISYIIYSSFTYLNRRFKLSSYLLEKQRLTGKSFDVSPRVAKVKESIWYWDELSLKEKAETLNLVRLIFSQLKTNIQMSWDSESFVAWLSAYREWELFVTETKELQEGLLSVSVDPAGVPLDYKSELIRDLEQAYYLFHKLMKVKTADVTLANMLSIVSNTTTEPTLKTLARYEADSKYERDEVTIITSFVNACKASSDTRRYTRVGEIAADYYLSHCFTGAIYRKTALMWFNQTKMLEPTLTGLIQRVLIKRIVRRVWIFYWSNRIRWNIRLNAEEIGSLLSAHMK